MKCTITVNGYVDWVRVPDGTPITDVDYATKRVKKHGDGNVYMKMRMEARPSVPGEVDHHHDCNPPEISIARRFAALAMLGRQKSRVQVIAELIQMSNEHHAEPDHYETFEVHDAAPSAITARAELLSERRLFAINHYRDTLARKALPSATTEREIAEWQMPKDTVIDEALLATYGLQICSDEKLEDLLEEYVDGYEFADGVHDQESSAAIDAEISAYLNTTFGAGKKTRRASKSKEVTK